MILAPKYRQQYAARWALLDRLGSVVAEATGAEGADISELVSYAEYGEPSFESVGYQNPYGFTGQPQDGGTGRVSFGSRDYDPVAAVWFAPDEWPGLRAAPQSLNRYAYVLGNPVTYADLGGYRPYEPGYSVTKNGSGWQYQKQAPKTVLNPSALLNHYGTGKKSGWNSSNVAAGGVVTPEGQMLFMSARHATAVRVCVAGDWSCEVKKTEDSPMCAGVGKFRHCKQHSGPGSYSYNYKVGGVVAGRHYTPEEVMRVFQENPSAVFPFRVENCPRFVTGVKCHLIDAANNAVLNDTGWVGVTTTSTSVEFTVLYDGYFDGAGSTVTFSTFRDSNGNIVLQQEAYGINTDLALKFGIDIVKGNEVAWDTQRENLRDLL